MTKTPIQCGVFDNISSKFALGSNAKEEHTGTLGRQWTASGQYPKGKRRVSRWSTDHRQTLGLSLATIGTILAILGTFGLAITAEWKSVNSPVGWRIMSHP
jgi:hypothetical protein